MKEPYEQKWQQIWQTEKAFYSEIRHDKPKYYVLEMLPYPSGKIHVGHIRNYSIGDVLARFMRARGYNVLHPMGWDAFGLPAENAAILNNSHPAVWTYENIDIMRRELQSIGFSYDWSKEITTADPDYYKHEQKFFIELFNTGLAYQKESMVNWDPVDQTVLANEQVENGRGWRSGAIVEKKYLKQWFLKITDYADELLEGLQDLPGWPEGVRHMQEKWIGKSIGAEIKFAVKNYPFEINIYTSRPETIFGASFVGISTSHPIITELSLINNTAIKKFIQDNNDIDSEIKDGVNTGLVCIHPFDKNRELPIIITNFILSDYGSGAIFGCPAHDVRDHELAMKLSLPITQVIETDTDNNEIIVNSGFLTGLDIEKAKEKIIKELEVCNVGNAKINYRLRDWGISRQRFWGCPIPIIYCDNCGVLAAEEEALPIELPQDADFSMKGNPLANHPTWKYVKCHGCGGNAERETDTFDTFFESSWYFTRYCSPPAKHMTDRSACDHWLPVDQYIGGIEHAVMHLLYARFFTKVMNDFDLVNCREPFTNLLTQGMVLHETYKDEKGNWLYPNEIVEQGGNLITKDLGLAVVKGRIEKMSKSKKNIIDLSSMLNAYGADVIRMFVLSDSPPERDLEWSASGIEGCNKFIQRLKQTAIIIKNYEHSSIIGDNKLTIITNQTIKYVTEDIIAFRLNKAIARVRELFNLLSEAIKYNSASTNIVNNAFNITLMLLNPFIPHITEELWESLGNSKRLYQVNWPEFDARFLQLDNYTLAIQINGKLRATYEFAADVSEEEIKNQVLNLESIQNYIKDKEIKKIICVPRKIINLIC